MPQLVKQIIQYRELRSDAHSRIIWELDEPVIYQYAVGHALPSLAPSEAKLHADKSEIYNVPLFNKKNHTKIVDPLGQHGLLHMQLMPGRFLESIFVEPAGISIDLILAKDGALIYEFYNTSTSETIEIVATIADDVDNIYLKISANPDDLEYRQYFVKLAKKNATSGSKVMDREIMTAKQAADYLGVATGTIANWTSEGKIPVVYAGASPRYIKADLELWLIKNKRK